MNDTKKQKVAILIDKIENKIDHIDHILHDVKFNRMKSKDNLDKLKIKRDQLKEKLSKIKILLWK